MTTPLQLGSTTPSSIFDPSDVTKLDCSCFQRLQIVNQPLGGSLIAWELKYGFKAKGPFNFYVDWARAGSNEWEVLNSAPLVNACNFADMVRRQFDRLSFSYYRVRLVLPDDIDPATNQCRVFASQPHQANGLWSKADWLLAREICRKEYLLQRKRTNMTNVGWILKRRRWGQQCKDCIEYDTGEPQTECDHCFGTRFEGGYYPAIDYRVTPTAPWGRGFKFKPEQGISDDVVRQGRAVNYPHLDTDDVYVRRDNGERYLIKKIETLAEVGGIPVVVQVTMNLVPATDIVYTIPLTGGASSASSESSASLGSCGANAGLPSTNDW